MKYLELITMGVMIGLLIWVVKEGATVWYMASYYAY